MWDMPTRSVRLTEKGKRELLEYGGSKGVKEGVALYPKAQKSREIFRKLEKFQKKSLIKTAFEKEVELIREGRAR